MPYLKMVLGIVDCSSTWRGLFIALVLGIIYGRGSVLVTLPHLKVMFHFWFFGGRIGLEVSGSDF